MSSDSFRNIGTYKLFAYNLSLSLSSYLTDNAFFSDFFLTIYLSIASRRSSRLHPVSALCVCKYLPIG